LRTLGDRLPRDLRDEHGRLAQRLNTTLAAAD